MCVAPFGLHEYYISVINLILVAVVGALGLNILVGYTGQISIGHAAFMSVGAYTAANLAVRLGLPFWLTLPAGGLMAAAVGAVVGIPSLRIKGLYLAIATLAGQLIIEWTINHVPWISGGVQASIEVPRPALFGMELRTQHQLYWFLRSLPWSRSSERSTWCAAASAAPSSRSATRTLRPRSSASTSSATSCSRSRSARSTPSDRRALHVLPGDRELRAVHDRHVDRLPCDDHHRGAGIGARIDLGAIFVTLLPIAIRLGMENWGTFLFSGADINNLIPNLRLIGFGGLIILFLVLEPEGLNRLWRNIRTYFRVWPFSY
jgi:branched-chain amino acid transport system permease protein